MTNNTFSLKKYWLQILLAIAVIILLFLLFKSNSDIKTLGSKNKAISEQLQAKDIELRQSIERYESDMVSKEKEISRMDTVIQTQIATIENNQTTLKKSGSLVKRLLKEASNEIPNISDSIDRIVASKIDSAASEFDALSIRYAEMEVNMDRLIEMQVQKDSAQAYQLKLCRNELETVRKAYAEVFTKYNLLYKDFQTIAKKTKRARFWNKALAAGILGTGAALILK